MKEKKTCTHGACYGPDEQEDIDSARKIAEQIGIPYHVFKCADEYEQIVLDNFKEEYLSGRTPNPCIRCNALVKFGVLPFLAKQNGLEFDKFATGHYARIEEKDGRYMLKKAIAPKKDQSYFLYKLKQDQLKNIIFPLGEYTKEEIRKIAKDNGLDVSDKPDSQDFYEGDYNELLGVGAMNPYMIYIPQSEVDTQAGDNRKGLGATGADAQLQIRLTFVLAEDITVTNGILSDDKRTVSFVVGYFKEDIMYAYTESSKTKISQDTIAPVISGLKKNKYYNESSLKKLRISDNNVLASVTCNDYQMKKSEKRGWYISSGKYKQGKNTVVAKDLSGNKTTYSFLYDGKGPSVKGLKSHSKKNSKNQKVVFYVKDKDSGIKKINYSKNNQNYKSIPKKNIKKVKSGKYKGYYMVTINCKKPCTLKVKAFDNAGNFTEIYDVKVNEY